jgi:hypothetical protein
MGEMIVAYGGKTALLAVFSILATFSPVNHENPRYPRSSCKIRMTFTKSVKAIWYDLANFDADSVVHCMNGQG